MLKKAFFVWQVVYFRCLELTITLKKLKRFQCKLNFKNETAKLIYQKRVISLIQRAIVRGIRGAKKMFLGKTYVLCTIQVQAVH